MFGRTNAEVITDFLLSLMHDKDINFPAEKFFNISSDGPNINKKTWQLLNEELRKTGHPGLLLLFCHSQRIPILMMHPFSSDISTLDG